MSTRKGSNTLTQEATQPGQVLEVRDPRRTTLTRLTCIRKAIISIERPHTGKEYTTRLTSTSEGITCIEWHPTDADIT
jgi:hypothetical protein